MAYKISEECIACGACEPECKNGAIKQGETYYAETIYIIDPNKCTECVGWFESAKCASVCPVDCCGPDSSHQETRQELIEKWRRLHPGVKPSVS